MASPMDSSGSTLREQGIQALNEGRFDQAADLLAQAVAADERDSLAKAYLGVADSRRGLHAQAKRSLQSAIQLQPGNAEYRYLLGTVLERAGDTYGAANAYRAALRHNADHTEAAARLEILRAAPAGEAAPSPEFASAPAPEPQPSRPVPSETPAPSAEFSPATDSSGMPAGAPTAVPPAAPAPATGNGPSGFPPPAGPSSGRTQPVAPPLGAPPGTPSPLSQPVPGSAASGPTHPGPRGTVYCAKCGEWSKPGRSCEWCAQLLPQAPPTPTPPGVSAPPGPYGGAGASVPAGPPAYGAAVPPAGYPPQPGYGQPSGYAPPGVYPSQAGYGPAPGYGAIPGYVYRKAHRGGLILTLGILGFFTCFLVGLAAWIMGNQDLAEMDAGMMDDSGRSLVQAGRILGIIEVVLTVLAFVFYLLLFAVFARF